LLFVVLALLVSSALLRFVLTLLLELASLFLPLTLLFLALALGLALLIFRLTPALLVLRLAIVVPALLLSLPSLLLVVITAIVSRRTLRPFLVFLLTLFYLPLSAVGTVLGAREVAHAERRYRAHRKA